jgi:hypothetical protein
VEVPVEAEDGSTPPERSPDEPGSGPPVQLTAAAVVAALEGVALVVLGGIWLVATVTGSPASRSSSLAGAVFVVVIGAVVLRLALGVRRLQSWARTPLLVLQMLFLPIGATITFSAGQPGYGLPVLLVSVTILVLLMTRASRLAFFPE